MVTEEPTHPGDTGYSKLADNSEAPKETALLAAHGELDEASTAIGVAVTVGYLPEEFDALLRKTQTTLADLGRQLPTPPPGCNETLAELDATLRRHPEPIPDDFTVSSERSDTAALLKLARAVTRRAERTLWALSRQTPSVRSVAVLLNRLADVLLMIAFQRHHPSAREVPLGRCAVIPDDVVGPTPASP